MDKKQVIVTIVGAAFNIAAIVTKALGLAQAADVLYAVMPEVNTVVLGILTLCGVTKRRLPE
jgi:uncharacterized membrane protein